MPELKLARLPDRTPTKLTIIVTPDLHQMLQQYASLYAATYGREESVVGLIPAMLAAFIESDRNFVRSRSTGK